MPASAFPRIYELLHFTRLPTNSAFFLKAVPENVGNVHKQHRELVEEIGRGTHNEPGSEA